MPYQKACKKHVLLQGMRKLVLLIVIGTLLGGCKSVKNAAKPANLNMFSMKALAKQNEETRPKNQMVYARMTARYETEDQLQNLVIKMRMQQDSVIWMSASVLGIQVAKIMLTPTEVNFYEKLGKSYYHGDYSPVEKFLGVKIDFEEIQRLLLGMPVRPLTEFKLNQTKDEKYYKLNPDGDYNGYLFYFLLNPNNFKLVSEQVYAATDNKLLAEVHYLGEIEVEKSIWPSSIKFKALDDKENEVNLTIEYKRIESRKRMSFPYRVPARYKQIKY
ncbi:MAG: DUF4292 domain-containing protein [Flavobacteriaceae bacterium]